MTATIHLIKQPSDEELMLFKRCCWATVGKTEEPSKLPSSEMLRKVLTARHSPIRVLTFAFLIEDVPYWVAMHLRTHKHMECFIQSQRNDRQDAYDREAARQDAPVSMIVYLNAEMLQILANKRLCNKAAAGTIKIVKAMCDMAEEAMPELKGLLVPMCEYMSGACKEIDPCWRATK